MTERPLTCTLCAACQGHRTTIVEYAASAAKLPPIVLPVTIRACTFLISFWAWKKSCLAASGEMGG